MLVSRWCKQGQRGSKLFLDDRVGAGRLRPRRLELLDCLGQTVEFSQSAGDGVARDRALLRCVAHRERTLERVQRAGRVARLEARPAEVVPKRSEPVARVLRALRELNA